MQSSAPFADRRSVAAKPVRLMYTLVLAGRLQRYHITPHQTADDGGMDQPQLKSLMPKLHPLDVAIARELCAGSVYGQLGDQQLARLLPLLAQRRTMIGEDRLRVDDETIHPRLRVQTSGRGRLELHLWFQDDEGTSFTMDDGRLIAGSQAFFLRENWALPIASPSPWDMAQWSNRPHLELDPNLTPNERDGLVRSLKKSGIPQEDLDALAVRRGPPDGFFVHVQAITTPPAAVAADAAGEAKTDSPQSASASTEAGSEAAPTASANGQADATTDTDADAEASTAADTTSGPQVQVRLHAQYGTQTVLVTSQAPTSPYLTESVDGQTQLCERDLVVEDHARQYLRTAQFRFDRTLQAFTARGEAALKAMDPDAKLFPDHWRVLRSTDAPVFHRDLSLQAKVQMVEERGLLDVQLSIEAISGDDAQVKALVAMKDLLAWLQSGKRYLQLEDGSFVAPSEQFRHSLRLVEDMGADSERVLISPLCVGLLRALGDAGALAVVDEATQGWMDEVLGCGGAKHTPAPADLQGTLREYQQRGLDWLMMLHRYRLTGILADDMGLGKTIQTLSLVMLVREMEGRKPCLVVAPTSVVGVWRDEAHRFAPHLKTVSWVGPPELRRNLCLKDADLVVTSYGVLRRDAEQLADVAFRYVILDEAQSAKNAASQNAQAVRQLTSERRLALTGTPIENRPEELWAAFDFLAPGFLGSLRHFRKRYARPIERGEQPAYDMLKARVSPLMLRRMKSEVATELPPKVEAVVRCDMGETQRALYEHVAGELRATVREKIKEMGIERAHLDILAALTRLRQICCDPALLPREADTEVPPSAKLALFKELMREALASNRCVVVFSQFVEMQKVLLKQLKKMGVDALWLHGGTRDRDKVVAQFQDPEGPPVIVVSLRAGGTGLTLTRADTVMHYDPWWNPAVEQQATDRAYRLGQKNQVTVYKLLCSGSIEERVQELASKKAELAAGLLGSEGGSETKRITTHDVLALLE